CMPAEVGTDPRDQCPDEGVATCGRDGVCDGAGACRKYAQGITCAQASCTGSTMTLASRCDATGTCPTPATQSCAPFICGANAVCQTVCAKDADCAAPNTCINSSCGKKPLGGACTTADECNSGFCEEGACCTTACKGICQSCSLAGTAGTCSTIPAGQDPLGQCADSGSDTCGLDGTCDGAGACRKYLSGTTCSPPTCTAASERATAKCDGAGVCVPGAVQACTPFICGPTACTTTCAVATDCAMNDSCIGGTCMKKSGGAACASAAECATGACEQGLCCDRACPGPCQACNLAGTAGVCSNVPAGQDPLNQCADLGASSCGTDGSCNGAGACRLYASGTSCAAGSCTGSTQKLASLCNGTGTCVAGTTQPCAPFLCGTSITCNSTCATNADCTTGNFCTNTSCGKKPIGGTCTATTDCVSGFCQQGFCCGGACAGTCQSCAIPGKEGTCSSVPAGQDPLNQCADQGTASCMTDGSCNGAGACELYVAGTTCVAATCPVGAGTFTQAQTCNGTGTCQAATSSPCGTYLCGTSNTCLTTCALPTDCAAGYVCNSGVCSKKLNATPCAAGTECQSGQCQQGVCCASSCTGTCRSCALTGTVGACTLALPGQDPLNQCADAGSTSCGTDGTCDGAGACHLYTAGTTCGGTTCAGSTFTSSPQCNGSGVCQPGTQSTCTPFVCGTGTGLCLVACAGNGDCVSPNTCNANVCGKKSDGATCAMGTECVHGNCNQATCCATACTGTCQSCALAGSLGTCKVVPAGTDPLNQCTDAGSASCANDGTCDGSGACRNYGAGTVCVGAMCAASSFKPARTCNGTGTCNTTTATNCGRYVCSGTGCLASCTTTADCTPPLLCSGGGCFTTLINAGGAAVGAWVADVDFTGGALNGATAATIDVTGLTNPAPQGVYQTGRAGPGAGLSYTIPGFAAGSSHTVRLHFCETYWPPAGGPGAGNRICNITLNGTLVLPNFDIFATAGAKNKAVIEPFTANANGAGAYVIGFTSVMDQCLINGIDIQ
ncbi:MAG TPA: malectin domain-containing carbohydrate-binding protein, partial [Polyangia bacterium]|nr:malectin domain-containing carbohydrate-binding protein [Polyangia bacterium]